MTLPSHLTRAALADFKRILRESRDFGPLAARATQAEFLAVFDAVAQGRALGHVRPDVPVSPNIRFVHVRRTSFIVVYDEDQKLVLRIIHGRRDFRSFVFEEPDRS